MLMEPDEYTSQERALTDKAKELIEQHPRRQPVAAVRGERHVDHVRCLRGRIPSNRLQDGDRRSA